MERAGPAIAAHYTVIRQPVPQRVPAAVEGRFCRRYDAARVREQCATRLRDTIDLDTVATGLCAVVQETMQPTHVSQWLQPVTASGGGQA